MSEHARNRCKPTVLTNIYMYMTVFSKEEVNCTGVSDMPFVKQWHIYIHVLSIFYNRMKP